MKKQTKNISSHLLSVSHALMLCTPCKPPKASEIGATLISILPMRKADYREVMQPAQGHLQEPDTGKVFQATVHAATRITARDRGRRSS